MAFGEKPAFVRYGICAGVGAILGGVGLSAMGSNEGSKFEEALRSQADRAAIGKPFDTEIMTTDSLATRSKTNIQFAIREMMRRTNQDPKKPEASVLAAAQCTLALANKIPLFDQARNEWSAAQSASRSEDDKTKEGADKLYAHAGQLCLTEINLQAEENKPAQLVFPVDITKD